MKISALIVFIFFLFSTLFSQEIKFSELNSGTSFLASYESYVASDGATYKVGEKIKIGFPYSCVKDTFSFIDDVSGPLSVRSSGKELEITRILTSGNHVNGYYIYLIAKGPQWLSNHTIFLENALASKEIISKAKSSDEALLELQKEKLKLDLEVITPEEYDKRKAELIKFIK